MSKQFYSSHRNPKLIQKAVSKLIEDNISDLITYVYDESNHQSILGHPEVRIGTIIKLLNNLDKQLDERVLRPVLNDINRLMNDKKYLEDTGNASLRHECLSEEYKYIEGYLDLDDAITLNTEIKTQATTNKDQSLPKPLDDQACSIQ